MREMPATVMLDRATVDGFRAGDDDAVREVYRAYSGLVYAVAIRVLRDRGLADEATQQSFLQAWRSAGRFEENRDLGPWLVTIARRVAIDIYRREARRPTTNLDDAGVGHPALVSLPPSEDQAWQVWQVRQAIDSLSPDERQIVQLQHLDGYTQSEIAERLGIALGTVKSRSFRAHKTLAVRLAHLRDTNDADDVSAQREPLAPRRRTDGGEEVTR
jgi:RNA polymerase sigma factor (sigma-70 family)